MNLTNLTYGENNLTIILYDLAGWGTEKTHLIIFDDKSPQIIIKEPTENAIYYSKFPLYIDIYEDYLEVVLISIKETKHNNTYNNIVIRNYLTCPENQTINVSIFVRDKAGNVNSTTIRVRCGIINDIAEDTSIIHSVKLVNGSVKISRPDEQGPYRVEDDKNIIYNKIVKINISVGNNTSGVAVLKYRIPQDYNLSNVYKILENGTTTSVDYNISDGFIYITLNLTVDPVLVIEFQKVETIPTSTEDTYSGGGSYSRGGGTTTTSHKRSTDSVKNEKNNIFSYFNYTINISNNIWAIEFEAFNISEKTIKVEIPYIKTIVIKPNQANTTGILEIKTVNITPLPNFKVKKAYLVRIVNGSVYIELSEPALCGYNTFTKCTSVNVSKMTYIVFGSLIKLYKPIQQQNVTIQPVKTSNKTLENVTSNETKEKQMIVEAEVSEDIKRRYIRLLIVGAVVLLLLMGLIFLIVKLTSYH
ncbi:MAG TPA: hypothetical protein EYH09_00005 [Candidatus Nanopusillus sp.]|nr:hypothetical protein [Candidatus Nanopusillus sp.]